MPNSQSEDDDWASAGTDADRQRTRPKARRPRTQGSLLGEASLERIHRLVDGERRRTLARRELLERFEEGSDDRRGGDGDPFLGHEPVPVRVRRDVRTLVRVRTEVVQLREAQRGERLRPDQKGPLGALLHEDELPGLVTERNE